MGLGDFLGSILGGKANFKPGYDYNPQVSGAYKSQEGARGEQAAFNEELRRRAMGQGPSVAEQLLRQQTSQNILSAQGQAGSQRGVNPALAARLAMDTGAGMNQQAAGQGAALRAGEMLQGGQLYSGALGQMRGQDLGAYGTAVGAQTAQDAVRAQIANANAERAKQWGAFGIGALGAGASQIAAMAAPGMSGLPAIPNLQLAEPGFLAGAPAGMMPGPNIGMSPGLSPASTGMSLSPGQFAQGGEVPLHQYFDSLVAPQPQPLPMPPPPTQYAGGGQMPFMGDGGVPGRAQVSGDSAKNDTVPAMLSPGEIVIPRSIAQAPDAPEKAKAFVSHLMRRGGDGFSKVLAARGSDGGVAVDTEESKMGEKLKAWWDSFRDEEKSRDVAEEVNKKLPKEVSGREGLKKNRERREEAWKASKDE